MDCAAFNNIEQHRLPFVSSLSEQEMDMHHSVSSLSSLYSAVLKNLHPKFIGILRGEYIARILIRRNFHFHWCLIRLIGIAVTSCIWGD
jgi:hypothetical protein